MIPEHGRAPGSVLGSVDLAVLHLRKQIQRVCCRPQHSLQPSSSFPYYFTCTGPLCSRWWRMVKCGQIQIRIYSEGVHRLMVSTQRRNLACAVQSSAKIRSAVLELENNDHALCLLGTKMRRQPCQSDLFEPRTRCQFEIGCCYALDFCETQQEHPSLQASECLVGKHQSSEYWGGVQKGNESRAPENRQLQLRFGMDSRADKCLRVHPCILHLNVWQDCHRRGMLFVSPQLPAFDMDTNSECIV